MKRNKLITLVVVFIVFTAAAVVGVLFLVTPPTGSVSLNNPNNVAVSVYKIMESDEDHAEEDHSHEEPVKIQDSKKTETIQLEYGEYCLSITDPDYSNSNAICFDIGETPTSATIDPDYSNAKLSDLLNNEIAAAQSVVRESYAEIISNYTMADDRLFKKGEWYGLSLTQKVSDPSDRGDVYHLILQRKNGTWEPVDIPRLSVNKIDLPNVPVSVLDEVNRMPGIH